ncbi:MAG: hypothetical protein Kow00100_24740 [Geothermobacteraceae bacterium]
MKHLKIATKIWLIVASLTLFSMVAVLGGRTAVSRVRTEALNQVDQLMHESYRQELKALVDSAALSYAAALERGASETEIRAKLQQLNNPVRFFDNKSGYFFIYDLKGVCQSLPPKRQLEGKSLYDLKDKNGTFLVRELIEKAKSGGGFVSYVWPKPPANDDKPKLSYARMIPGTPFWIGTGIYIDDIAERQDALSVSMSERIKPVLLWGSILLALCFFGAVLPFVFYLIRQIVRPVHQITDVARALERGEVKSRCHWDSRDEVGVLAGSLNSMAERLEHYAVQARQIADGDLTVEIKPASTADIFGNALKQMVGRLGELLQQIQMTGEQVASGSRQVNDTAQSLSRGATESAASIEEISASMNEISSQTAISAENANTANRLSTEVMQTAQRGNSQMQAMVGAMDEIRQAGQDISKIIKVIDEIAFQTNLLALNAAVEAARAGQHGKGFAVVAEEVRNLAARSAKAAQETTALIEQTVEKTEKGAGIADTTAEALGEIVNGVTRVSDLLEEIATASNEQIHGVSQINEGLAQIDQVIQQTTANAEESAATAEELSHQAAALRSMLGRFHLAENHGGNQTLPAIPQHSEQSGSHSRRSADKSATTEEAIIKLDDGEFGRY